MNELEKRVIELYESKNPGRADWADWLFENHVIIVADTASLLAKKYNANEAVARTSALLHDIADAVMKRNDSGHEEKSLSMAKELLDGSEMNEDDKKIILEDALPFHGCRDGKYPKTLEGRILSSADAMAHFQTDFYLYFLWASYPDNSFLDTKEIVLKKIDRDFQEKIQFDEEREVVKPDYEALRHLLRSQS